MGTCLFFLLGVAESPFLPGCPALGRRREERGKQGADCARTVCQHPSGSFACSPHSGLGCGWGPSRDHLFRGKVGSAHREAESRQANVFTQRLEQVGGPSANLSQLPLPAGTTETKEGGPGEAGRGAAEPPRVSVRCTEPYPSSKGGGAQGRAKSGLPALPSGPGAERALPSRIVRQPGNLPALHLLAPGGG